MLSLFCLFFACFYIDSFVNLEVQIEEIYWRYFTGLQKVMLPLNQFSKIQWGMRLISVMMFKTNLSLYWAMKFEKTFRQWCVNYSNHVTI